jgi:FixJ family two-component response regulator
MGSDLRQVPLVAVIEADASVAWAVAKLIRSAGFSEEVFASAEQFVRSNQPCTRCLVVDVQLPGMSGLQLQSHLASAGRHIPIIFINASADERARALAFELGAVEVAADKASGYNTLLKEIGWMLKPRDGGEPASFPSSRKPGSNIGDEKL